jgi:tartrate dehydrogenase/decarboxylase/D-malate dehydrogenase
MHTMPFWDERFRAISTEYPDVSADQFHIDILAAHFVQHPDWFDVVVGSNLFGDILSDLGPAVAGGIGIAASANLNPEREYPSMFEPVHGSAPDIAGQGIANPIGTLWSAQMMLDFLGEDKAAQSLMSAIENATSTKRVTVDLGGSATTRQCADAVIACL